MPEAPMPEALWVVDSPSFAGTLPARTLPSLCGFCYDLRANLNKSCV